MVKKFNGELAGKKISDFNLSELKNVDSYEERLEVLMSVIGNEDGEVHEFFGEYFDNCYDASPSQSGYLAEENEVCKVLEIMSTYLLSAKDIKSERKIQYRFWKSERDFKKSNEYKNNVNTSSLNKNAGDVEVIDMFSDRKNDKNDKIVKPISVSKKDMRDIKEIGDLEKAIEYIKSKKSINEIKEKAKHILDSGLADDTDSKRTFKYMASSTEKFVDSYVRSLKEDQLAIKLMVKRPIEFKSTLRDSGFHNKLDVVDLMDKEHVKALLDLLVYADYETDAGIILSTIISILDSVKLTDREKSIVEMFKKGYSRRKAMNILDISRSNMNNSLNRLADKITNEYERQMQEYKDKTGVYPLM